VCYSLAELRVKSVYLNLFGWRGREVHETFQRGAQVTKFENLWPILTDPHRLLMSIHELPVSSCVHIPHSCTSRSGASRFCRFSLFYLSLSFMTGAGVAQSVMYDHRLNDLGLIPGRGKRSFPLTSVSSSEAYPASYPMGTGSPSPGVKRGRDVTLTTHSHLVPMSGMNKS
jgi:hypothetical protein